MQKKPFANVLQNRCSYKFCNIHWKALVLECLFNKVAGLQLFSWEWSEIFESSLFYETPPVATSADVFFYIMSWKRRCWIYCSYIFHNSFILKPKITLIRFHSLSFIVPLVGICRTTCCFRFHLLSLVAIHCHLLSLVVTSCYSLCRSLSFVVTCCTTGCNSWSLDVLFVCLFISDPLFESILFSRMFDQVCLKMCWEVCENCQ